MPRNSITADSFVFDRYSFDEYSAKSTNTDEIRRMKSVLSKALARELSQKQAYCITEYYLKGKKMKDIARDINVNPSTVTRHIRRAREKLEHIASFF